MIHHADFAVSVNQPIEATTRDGRVSGRVIALGWWVDATTADDPDHEPTGTLYLIVDERHARPMWVAEGELGSVRVLD